MIKNSKPMYSISVVTEILNVHPRTLRIWEEQKLVMPKRTKGDRRIYSMDDIHRCESIKLATNELGMNINGVKILLSVLKPNEFNKMYLKEIGLKAGISEESQKINAIGNSNKGRRAK